MEFKQKLFMTATFVFTACLFISMYCIAVQKPLLSTVFNKDQLHCLNCVDNKYVDKIKCVRVNNNKDTEWKFNKVVDSSKINFKFRIDDFKVICNDVYNVSTCTATYKIYEQNDNYFIYNLINQ